MKNLFALVFLLILTNCLVAQKPNLSGLVLDEEEYNSLPFTAPVSLGRKALVSDIDLSPYCPEIRHQGDISSCVGWSVGYGAMTIERAIKNGWSDRRLISQKANSALFVYNQISKGNCSMGISMPKALKLIQEKGNCLAKDFDFDINDCSRAIPLEVENKAIQYRIDDYVPLFRSTATAEEKIKQVKLVLAQEKPVVVGMTVLSNFYQIRAGDKTWLPSIGDKTYAGGHAMVVVGYDDNKFNSALRPVPEDMKGGFKLMNSWGKNWGDQGFIWVKYGHFAEYCKQAFALMLSGADPINFNLDQEEHVEEVVENSRVEQSEEPELLGRDLDQFSGEFGFRSYLGWEDGPQFEEAPVKFNKNHYLLQKGGKLGDQFQLYVKSGFDGGYIYVFSIDGRNQPQIHFPRSADYNTKFAGKQESALVWEEGAELIIPEKLSALELSKRGKEHLVVLFTTNKIKAEYLKLLVDELTYEKDNLIPYLFEILGEYKVPFTDVNFKTDKMGFEVSTRSGGKIVPIVLEVDVL